MSNLDKARRIVYEILTKDYNGDWAAFQAEYGSDEAAIIDVYWWLEDGHGNGRTVEECRLLWELY